MFLSREENRIIKKQIEEMPSTKAHLKALADKAMSQGPWSVTDHHAPCSKGGPQDYYSEGPYWWPNPLEPEGPYIRKDGAFNPNHFKAHKIALRRVCKNVLILASAGYHLSDEAYSVHAMALIRVWFLDEATAMTPHLTYGQSIPGICDGRGIGLIDTLCLIECLQGVAYMEQEGLYKEEIHQLRRWFTEFLTWMCTSNHGLEEKSNGNNHATWWTLQVMAYAQFVGDQTRFDMAIDWYKEVILKEQMALDGSFPKELERTRSFHYSLFNLIPMVMICDLAYSQGQDLWQYTLADGRGVGLGLSFMYPYLKEPEIWPYPSLDQLALEDSILLILVCRRLTDKGYQDLRRKLMPTRVVQDDAMNKVMLPLCIWPRV